MSKKATSVRAVPPPESVVLSPLPLSGSQPVTGHSESGLQRWLTAGPILKRMEAIKKWEDFCQLIIIYFIYCQFLVFGD